MTEAAGPCHGALGRRRHRPSYQAFALAGAGCTGSALRLAQHVAQPIGRHDEEGAIWNPIHVLLIDDPRLGPISLELGERRVEIVHLEEASFLRRIATVLCQSDLDSVANEDHTWMWFAEARPHTKTKRAFVVWNRRFDVVDRQLERIIGVGHGPEKNCLRHNGIGNGNSTDDSAAMLRCEQGQRPPAGASNALLRRCDALSRYVNCAPSSPPLPSSAPPGARTC